MSKAATTEGLGFTAMAAAAFAFSWGALLVKAVGMPAPSTLFWRLFIGSVALLAALLVLRRSPSFGGWREQSFIALTFALHQWAFVLASSLTSVAMVALMVGMQPLLVTLLALRVTGESISARLLGWALLAVLGAALLFFADPGNAARSMLGDVFAVLNLLFYVAYFFASKRARLAGAGALPLTFVATAGALLFVVPGLAWAPLQMPPEGEHWLLLVALALGAGNGHLLVNWAHSRISAGLASMVLSSVPFLAGLWAHWVFHEPYGVPHVLGALCVAIAVEGARRSQNQLGA
jgi:drug/metabolite transporter (DMT)-like permease